MVQMLVYMDTASAEKIRADGGDQECLETLLGLWSP